MNDAITVYLTPGEISSILSWYSTYHNEGFGDAEDVDLADKLQARLGKVL